MSTPKRGRSDDLDEDAQTSMYRRLLTYCKRHCDALWEFGPYVSGQVNAKKAPILDAIVRNFELFDLLLDFWTHGKMKDMQFKAVMVRVLSDLPCANTLPQYDNQLFVEWLTQRIHIQITHIRDIVRYKARFMHRLASLSPEDMTKMRRLIDKIKCEDADSVDYSSPAHTTASSSHCSESARHRMCLEDCDGENSAAVDPPLYRIAKGIPERFKASPTSSLVVASSSSAALPQTTSCAIPLRFRTASSSAAPIPASPSDLFAEALAAPYVPPAKGAMKQLCGIPQAKKARGECLQNSHGRLCITHARTNPRSYIRCKSDIPAEHGLWVEISAKRHADHHRMIEAIAAKAVADDLCCRQVKALRDRYLASWPDIP